jgi:hypothetical protein
MARENKAQNRKEQNMRHTKRHVKKQHNSEAETRTPTQGKPHGQKILYHMSESILTTGSDTVT